MTEENEPTNEEIMRDIVHFAGQGDPLAQRVLKAILATPPLENSKHQTIVSVGNPAYRRAKLVADD